MLGKKQIKHFFTLIIISVFFPFYNSMYAGDIDKNISQRYDNFLKKITLQLKDNQKIEQVLQKLNTGLSNALKNTSNQQTKTILQNLFVLNNAEIQKIHHTQNTSLFEKNILFHSHKDTLKFFPLLSSFPFVSYDKNDIFLENGIWYAYVYSSYKFFKDVQGLRIDDLLQNGINPNTDLLIVAPDGNIAFVPKAMYKKIPLISESILTNIADKYSFLSEVKDDKNFLNTDTDALFIDLKNTAQQVIKDVENGSEQEKIHKIYTYILDNITYSYGTGVVFNDSMKNNYPIFSGIDTFKNKNGVCEGYAKLFKYMLNFVGISNVEVERGYVIDADDFPNIGHAWVKVGDYFYDPTFDDPIGGTEIISTNDYKYYQLPHDLFYTNRFLLDDLPSNIPLMSLQERKSLVQKNLSALLSKYVNNHYILLDDAKFRQQFHIAYDKTIYVEDLKTIFPFYQVDPQLHLFLPTPNGTTETKYLKKLRYLTINDANVESVLVQIKYNTSDYILLKWYTTAQNYEYRLAYDVEFYEAQ